MKTELSLIGESIKVNEAILAELIESNPSALVKGSPLEKALAAIESTKEFIASNKGYLRQLNEAKENCKRAEATILKVRRLFHGDVVTPLQWIKDLFKKK